MSTDAPEYLVERVRDALAEDGRTAAMGIEVRLAGQHLFLHGTVSSQEQRDAATVVASDAADSYAVCNELTVVDLADGVEEPLQ